jgi:predicted esterase
MYKKAGAKVLLHWEENFGHELGYDEISAAKEWFANVPIK